MVYFIYNLFFPLAFLFFIPGMIVKLIRRPGHKSSYLEKFAIFSKEVAERLRAMNGPIWIHSVSVGETIIALAFIEKWLRRDPNLKFVLSTTTTTGQELARSKAPQNAVEVIFCPIDLVFWVKKTVSLVKPKELIIFETEIWPNLTREVRVSGGRVVLVNARMSDKSYKGYYRFRLFFRAILKQFDLICAQSTTDKERFESISPETRVNVCGNLKFDQEPPANQKKISTLDCFGEEDSETSPFTIILAASTHPGEEKLLAKTFKNLKKKHENLRLVIVPRHAERGNEIVGELKNIGISYHRRSTNTPISAPVDCLLADTTGEMLGFIEKSDIVFMGKSLAGHDEGHNLIEPALLGKPIVTGSILRNFRFVLKVLRDADALITVDDDSQLEPALDKLAASPELRKELGEKANQAIAAHRGAANKIFDLMETLK